MQSYLLVTLILASGLLADESPTLGTKFTESKLRQTIIDRCSKYSNATVGKDFYDVILPKAEKCLDEAHDGHTCADIVKGLKECELDLLNKLKPCMNPEEYYFVEVIPDVHSKIIAIMCKGNSENTKWGTEGKSANCSSSINSEEDMLEQCSAELNFTKYIDELDFVYTKAEICSDSERLFNCAIAKLKSECTNPEKLIEIATAVYTESTKPCNDAAEN